MTDESHYLSKCLLLIEEKLGWGKSSDWQTRDFESLSERMFEETKVLISTSTLKRIWGKVRYDSAPNMATLNTLAQFIGVENWRAFIAAEKGLVKHSRQKSARSSRLPIKALLLGFSFLFIIVFTGFWLNRSNTKHLQFNNLQFSSRSVTLGLPNTVIFNYDASQSNADSVFISKTGIQEGGLK